MSAKEMQRFEVGSAAAGETFRTPTLNEVRSETIRLLSKLFDLFLGHHFQGFDGIIGE